MASIAFFTNAGISAFNTAQSTNEQVLIEQIRIASESTADETTTVLTALYECNIQDIIKSVDGMSFTIKSIIAKNTFTSTEISPVRVIGYYGRISNGGAKTLLAIALVDPIVNSDGTKSFVINSTFSLTPTAATTIRLTVSPYLSYVTVNDLASYTTISAFEARKTVVDNELNDRFTKDEVNTKLVDYVAKNEIGPYINNRQNVVNVKYGEDITSGDMIKISPVYNPSTGKYEAVATKATLTDSDNTIHWAADASHYNYSWWTGTSNPYFDNLYFSSNSDIYYDTVHNLYIVLHIDEHRFTEFSYLDSTAPDATPIDVYVDIYEIVKDGDKYVFSNIRHYSLFSIDRSVYGVSLGNSAYHHNREFAKSLKIIYDSLQQKYVFVFDTINYTGPGDVYSIDTRWFIASIPDSTKTLSIVGSGTRNISTGGLNVSLWLFTRVTYTFSSTFGRFVVCRERPVINNTGELVSDYTCDTLVRTCQIVANSLVFSSTDTVISGYLLLAPKYLENGVFLVPAIKNRVDMYIDPLLTYRRKIPYRLAPYYRNIKTTEDIYISSSGGTPLSDGPIPPATSPTRTDALDDWYAGGVEPGGAVPLYAVSTMYKPVPLTSRHNYKNISKLADTLYVIRIDNVGAVISTLMSYNPSLLSSDYILTNLAVTPITGRYFLLSHTDNQQNIVVKYCEMDPLYSNFSSSKSVNIPFFYEHDFSYLAKPYRNCMTWTYDTVFPSSALFSATENSYKMNVNEYSSRSSFYAIQSSILTNTKEPELLIFGSSTNVTELRNDYNFMADNYIFRCSVNEVASSGDTDYYHLDATFRNDYIRTAMFPDASTLTVSDAYRILRSSFDNASDMCEVPVQLLIAKKTKLLYTELMPIDFSSLGILAGTTSNTPSRIYDIDFCDDNMTVYNDNIKSAIITVKLTVDDIYEIRKYRITITSDNNMYVTDIFSYDNKTNTMSDDDDGIDIDANVEYRAPGSGFMTFYSKNHDKLTSMSVFTFIKPSVMKFVEFDDVMHMITIANPFDFFSNNQKLSHRMVYRSHLGMQSIYTANSFGLSSIPSLDRSRYEDGVAVDTCISGEYGNVSLFDNIVNINNDIPVAGGMYYRLGNNMVLTNSGSGDVFYKHVGGSKFMRGVHRFKKVRQHIRRYHLRDLFI